MLAWMPLGMPDTEGGRSWALGGCHIVPEQEQISKCGAETRPPTLGTTDQPRDALYTSVMPVSNTGSAGGEGCCDVMPAGKEGAGVWETQFCHKQ